MTRADLPLISEPGQIASKRKNDHKGFVNLDKSKVKRFDGEGSMYRRDSLTHAYQASDPFSPTAKLVSPDRNFNKTVSHSFPMSGLELPKERIV